MQYVSQFNLNKIKENKNLFAKNIIDYIEMDDSVFRSFHAVTYGLYCTRIVWI